MLPTDSKVRDYIKEKFTLIEKATRIEDLTSIEKKSTLKGKRGSSSNGILLANSIWALKRYISRSIKPF